MLHHVLRCAVKCICGAPGHVTGAGRLEAGVEERPSNQERRPESNCSDSLKVKIRAKASYFTLHSYFKGKDGRLHVE